MLSNLSADVEANGVVIEFSDSGHSPRAFAVVRLTRNQTVLLPVTAIRVLGEK